MMRVPTLAAFLTSVLAAPAVQADTIRFIDGRKPQSNIEVVNETLKAVEYKLPQIRQVQSYPADNVAEVVYSGVPEAYDVAVSNLESQAFEAAADLFLASAGESDDRKGLQAKAMYRAAEALRQGGQFDRANEVYGDLVQQQPESRYVPHAKLGRGLALLHSGDAERARQVFNQLKDASYGDRWRFEAELQLAVLDEGKNPQQALATYQRLAGQTEGTYPSVANQARLRVGRVYIASKQFDKAKDFFRNILAQRSASSREIIAGAFNGLGTALRNQPNASAEDWREALYAHLRVVVSFPDVTGEQPEALYGAGQAFQHAEGVEDAQNRSRSMFYRCVTEYGDSEWADKARKG